MKCKHVFAHHASITDYSSTVICGCYDNMMVVYLIGVINRRDDLPMKQLKVTVANSLKSLLTQLKKQEEQKSAKDGGPEVQEDKCEASSST